MMSISVNIPDGVLFDTKMTHDAAEQYVRQTVALGYYTKNGVSLGYCAEIAGMSKSEFIELLGQNGISIFQVDSEEELLEDIRNA